MLFIEKVQETNNFTYRFQWIFSAAFLKTILDSQSAMKNQKIFEKEHSCLERAIETSIFKMHALHFIYKWDLYQPISPEKEHIKTLIEY